MDDVGQIDLSNWILVFKHPHLTWVGEVENVGGDPAVVTVRSYIKLKQAHVLQSVDMMVPPSHPNGRPQQVRNTTLLPVHGFTHDVPVHVRVEEFTWVKELHDEDQAELRRMIEMHRDAMMKRRLGKLGIAT